MFPYGVTSGFKKQIHHIHELFINAPMMMYIIFAQSEKLVSSSKMLTLEGWEAI